MAKAEHVRPAFGPAMALPACAFMVGFWPVSTHLSRSHSTDRAVRPARREGRRDRDPASHHPGTPHPKARPENPGSGDDAPRATGVDYIALLGEQHDRERAQPVNYHALTGPDGGDSDRPASGQQERGERGAGEEDDRG